MASVFLSYAREDANKARSLANALETAGHTVWWDLYVRGGSEFSKAIEQALGDADAVVVIWSQQSVDSPWVRDEAAAGRDAGKLVPVTIDGTEAPLGFRQYQSICLDRWRGRSKAVEFMQLVNAIQSLAGENAAASGPTSLRVLPTRFSKPHLVAALVVVAILVGAAFTVFRFAARSSVTSVAVVAANPSDLSEALASDLFVKLGHLDVNSAYPMEISLAQSQKKTDFSLEVTNSVEAQQMRAGAALLDRDKILLWSRDFEAPRDKQGDLRQRVALATASVLECADEAIGRGKLGRQTLKMYLNGCAGLAEANTAKLDWRSLSRVFRAVVEKAPQFDGAWDKLLLCQSFVIALEMLPANSPEVRQLRQELTTLKKQGRDLPASYWAEVVLLPSTELGQAARIVEQGVTRHPDSAAALSYYSVILIRVGRMKDAVAALKRATELDPLSVSLLADYINTLAWAGQLDTARLELKKAETLWPETSSLLDSRWRFALRYGDPKESIRISTANPDYRGFERYLAARLDPRPVNIDLAIAEAKLQVGNDPRAYGYLAQVLAEFGQEEQLYELLRRLKREQLGDGDIFFRPAFHRFRSDVRFMEVAKRLNLVDYWQKTGKWPDFCFEPDLPYKCQAEAAKLAI